MPVPMLARSLEVCAVARSFDRLRPTVSSPASIRGNCFTLGTIKENLRQSDKIFQEPDEATVYCYRFYPT